MIVVQVIGVVPVTIKSDRRKKEMCPISSTRTEAPVVPARNRRESIAVEVLARDVFEYLNLPTYFKVGESGSLTVGFGHFNDKKVGRDHQWKIVVEKPRETFDELKQMESDWYRLRNLARTSSGREKDEAWEAFNALKARFLDIIGQPALAEFVTPNLWILHPLPAETEVHASLLVYTTFEDDATIELPNNEGLMHGKFRENGHVIAAVIKEKVVIRVVALNGRSFFADVEVPDGMAFEDAIFPPDAAGRHDDETPAVSDDGENTGKLGTEGGEDGPFLPERRPRSGRKPAAVGAGRGKSGSKRGLAPADVGVDEDE